MRWPWRTPACKKCRDRGFVESQELIPASELHPRQQAELMVLGGRAVRIIQTPCDCGAGS